MRINEEPTYFEEHDFQWIFIDDGLGTLWKTDPAMTNLQGTRLYVFGPVFPDFLTIDFNSYESFRTFITHYGIDGFLRYDKRPKGQALQGKLNNQSLKGEDLKTLLAEIRPAMIIEQTKMQEVWDILKDTGGVESSNAPEIMGALNEIVSHEKDIDPGSFNAYKFQDIRTYPKGPVLVCRKRSYKTIIARCYKEIYDLFRDGRTVKDCKNPDCKRPFVPSRPDQEYCSRIAPNVEIPYSPELESPELCSEYLKKFSCQVIGPRKIFKKRLLHDEEYRLYRWAYNAKHVELRRIKRKHGEKSDEYKSARSAFEKWNDKNKPKKAKKGGEKKAAKPGEELSGN